MKMILAVAVLGLAGGLVALLAPEAAAPIPTTQPRAVPPPPPARVTLTLVHGGESQTFVFEDWLGGFYASPAMQGTRPAMPMACAWAVLHHLGLEGYLRLTSATIDATRRMAAGIRPPVSGRGRT